MDESSSSSSLGKESESTLLVALVDTHSTRGIRVCTNLERVKDSPLLFSDDLEHPFPDSEGGIECSSNDLANIAIMEVMKCNDIDVVFGTSLDEVSQFLYDRLCRMILFHLNLSEMKRFSSLTSVRTDLLRVLLLPSGDSSKCFNISFNEVGNGVYLPSEPDGIHILLSKPFDFSSFLSEARKRISDFLFEK